jgi:hypothetical protein
VFAGGGSIETWLNADSDGEGSAGRIAQKGWSLITFEEAAGDMRIRIAQPFSGVSGIWKTTNLDITAGDIHHVVVTYDSDATVNDPIIYVDSVAVGVDETQTPVGVASSDAGNDMFLGNDTGDTSTFDGHLDEIAIYDAILSPAEVSTHYAAGATAAAATTARSDVWASSDGAVWFEVGADALPAGRYNYGLAIFEGSIYLMGGEDTTADHDDVYFTDAVVGLAIPTPVPVDSANVALGATTDQSGGTSDANLPLGEFLDVAATASSFPIRFLWVLIAMSTTLSVSLLVAKLTPNNLIMPAIVILVVGGMWMIIGQGIIPFWAQLALLCTAFGFALVGREVLS